MNYSIKYYSQRPEDYGNNWYSKKCDGFVLVDITCNNTKLNVLIHVL